MHAIPQIVAVMTPFPYHVRTDTPLAQVEATMAEHGIRHLPVVDGDDVVGIISDRDLKHLSTWGHHAGEESELIAGDLCAHRPYLADVSDPLDRVLDAMEEKRLGAVIVLKQGELAGIFTATDACRLLAHKLRKDQGQPPGTGDDVA